MVARPHNSGKYAFFVPPGKMQQAL